MSEINKYCVNKWNVNQNVSLVPRVEKAKSSQLFYFIIFCDLIVHFVKFFKSFNILSMISHFISWLKPMADDTRDQGE